MGIKCPKCRDGELRLIQRVYEMWTLRELPEERKHHWYIPYNELVETSHDDDYDQYLSCQNPKCHCEFDLDLTERTIYLQ